jgi:hypothetical protein
MTPGVRDGWERNCQFAPSDVWRQQYSLKDVIHGGILSPFK